MNNYSWLQQKLHKFALGSRFMREIAFDIESLLFNKKDTKEDMNIFVAGLARSGTTVLLNAFHQTNEFSSLSYDDMPFVLSPNLWSRISPSSKNDFLFERAHGDGIKTSLSSPEAFEEVFWNTFNEHDTETLEKFRNYIKIINYKYNKKRYLSKNNQNIRRLDFLSINFEKSRILVTYRNPVQHSYSLLTQHKRFIDESSKDKFVGEYMRLIGHSEFGPFYKPIVSQNINYDDDTNINHWLEQWILVYEYCLSLKENRNIIFISYEELCNNTEFWPKILEILELSNNNKFQFRESIKDPPNVEKKLLEKASIIYRELQQETLKIF